MKTTRGAAIARAGRRAAIAVFAGALTDRVAFVAVDHELRAFDTRTGKQLFDLETEGTISSAPVVVGRRVYFGSGVSYFPPTKSGRTVYALEG